MPSPTPPNPRDPETQRRYDEYKATIRPGVCPFCELDKEINKVILRERHWTVIENAFPYRDRIEHLVAFPTVHAERVDDLRHNQRSAFWTIAATLEMRNPRLELSMRLI